MNQQTYNLAYIQSTWNHFFSNRWQYWRVIAVLFTKQHIISQKLSGTRWMDNDMLYFLFNFKNNSIYNFFLSAILMIHSYDEISSWDQSTQAFITRNIFLHSVLILITNRQVYQMFKHPVIFYIYYNILCQLEYVCLSYFSIYS